jgi:hypothetical protein
MILFCSWLSFFGLCLSFFLGQSRRCRGGRYASQLARLRASRSSGTSCHCFASLLLRAFSIKIFEPQRGDSHMICVAPLGLILKETTLTINMPPRWGCQTLRHLMRLCERDSSGTTVGQSREAARPKVMERIARRERARAPSRTSGATVRVRRAKRLAQREFCFAKFNEE